MLPVSKISVNFYKNPKLQYQIMLTLDMIVLLVLKLEKKHVDFQLKWLNILLISIVESVRGIWEIEFEIFCYWIRTHTFIFSTGVKVPRHRRQSKIFQRTCIVLWL